MSTQHTEQVAAQDKISSIGLEVKGADLENNILDAFRSRIAVAIAELSEKSADDIFALLDAPKNPEHGDFALAVPRLRVKGNPAQFAKSWAEKVNVTLGISLF